MLKHSRVAISSTSWLGGVISMYIRKAEMHDLDRIFSLICELEESEVDYI